MHEKGTTCFCNTCSERGKAQFEICEMVKLSIFVVRDALCTGMTQPCNNVMCVLYSEGVFAFEQMNLQ